MYKKFWSENVEEREQSEDLNVDERTVLYWMLKKSWEVVDLVHLAQDRNQWQAAVNTVTNIWVP
jgi:hypothetical protein